MTQPLNGLELSRVRGSNIAFHVDRIARRVERIRGLRFRRVPGVVVIQPNQLARLGQELRRDALARLERRPARLARGRRLARAQAGFESLAGLLPVATATDISASSASEQIGGAYDYRHNRVVLVDRVVQTRHQLKLVLAHELTHALEDQHFALHIVTSRGPSQAAQARRALIEGTATFVAGLYDGRYLGNRLPVGMRIAGQRSVFAAGGGTPFALKAGTIFAYVDGPQFIQRLYQRAGQSWSSVNAALRGPPRHTQEILHPANWPPAHRVVPVRLGLTGLLAPERRLAGGGVAGEEDALAVLSEGAPPQLADAAAAGWRGGRFELWRLRDGSCAEPCRAEDVGVIGLRFRDRSDVPQFGDAFFDYALLGLLGQRIGPRTWRLADGYAALETARRSAAIAFAPAPRLAHLAAATAARAALHRV